MAFSATGNGGNSGIPSAQQSINLPTNVLSGSSTIPPSGLISSGGLEQLQQQPHNQLDMRVLSQIQTLIQQQQQQQNVAGTSANVNAINSTNNFVSQQATAPGVVGVNSGSLPNNVYQQLVLLQAQQQQQQQQTTVSALPQQFNSALHLQQSSSTATNVLQLGAASHLPTQQQQTCGVSALSNLFATNPTLLHQLLSSANQTLTPLTQQQPHVPLPTAASNPALAALANQLLIPTAQQQQQQQSPHQQHLLGLLQTMNPNTALYAYQNYLQQAQQAQQAQQLSNTSVQLNALLALLGNQLNGGNIQNSSNLLLNPLPLGQNLTISEEHRQLLIENLIRQIKTGNGSSIPLLTGRQFDATVVNHQPSPAITSANEQQQQVQQQQQNPWHHLLTEQTERLSERNERLSASVNPILPQTISLTSTAIAEGAATTSSMGTGTGSLFNSPTGSRQSSSDRLASTEDVQERITRLINENDRIVEPNPVLMKRRPYQRQSTSNSITSQLSGGTDPGLVAVKSHPATTRSNSLYDTFMRTNTNGSLTSGQPLNRPRNLEAGSNLVCSFCTVKFPNETSLEQHEKRCRCKENKDLLVKQQSQPQLTFQFPPQQQLQIQQQQPCSQQIIQHLQLQHLTQQQQQKQISTFGGFTNEFIVNGSGNFSTGRSSVPATQNTVRMQQQQRIVDTMQLDQRSIQSPTNLDARQKKRVLELSDPKITTEESHDQIDVVSADQMCSSIALETNDQQSSASKMARMDDDFQLFLQLEGLKRRQEQTQQQTFQQNMNPTIDSLLQNMMVIQKQQKLTVTGTPQQYIPSEQQENQRQPLFVQVPTTTKQKCPNGMCSAINSAVTYSTCLKSSLLKMPYYLTLQEEEDGTTVGRSVTPYRNRTRNITSHTFACLNTRPTYYLAKDNSSVYAKDWTRPNVNIDDEKLIDLLFASNTLPKIANRTAGLEFHYSIACDPKHIVLRPSNSSFFYKVGFQIIC